MAKPKSGGPKALRFTRLRLENWMNFQEVDVRLQGRVFLVGPNASGKSNLLDALRFLRDIVAVGGGFRKAVDDRKGVSAIRCLAARRYSDVAIEVEIGHDDAPSLWKYRIQFSQDNQRLPVLKREMIQKQSRLLHDRPTAEDRRDPELLSQTYLEQINVNRDFREIPQFLSSIRYLHLVPQFIRKPERLRREGGAEDPYGADFLETIARTPSRTRDAWLRQIRKALALAVPQLSEFEFYWDQTRGEPHLRGKYSHWRPQGAWQTEQQFSDGTLRLLGMLWCTLEHRGPLLLEEPELSLHPDVVRQIPAMLARMQRRTGRQVLLSTHSPDMLQDQGLGLDEVFVIKQTSEGSRVQPVSQHSELSREVTAGIPLPEVVLPETAPRDIEQLSLF